MTKVTVWNEHVHEQEHDEVAEIYPDGIHGVIADALEERGFETRTATLDDPEHGLTEDVLAETDVLTWWGHAAHDEVDDEVVEREKRHVLDGMGLLVLHSAHYSKIFRALMGNDLRVEMARSGRDRTPVGDNPAHPIADGIDDYFEVPDAEMYGEHFDVPEPDSLVFTSWFEGGEVFRSGCSYFRGEGRIFDFRSGHETYPVYHQDEIQRVLGNACEWAARNENGSGVVRGNHAPIEDIDTTDTRSVHELGVT